MILQGGRAGTEPQKIPNDLNCTSHHKIPLGRTSRRSEDAQEQSSGKFSAAGGASIPLGASSRLQLCTGEETRTVNFQLNCAEINFFSLLCFLSCWENPSELKLGLKSEILLYFYIYSMYSGEKSYLTEAKNDKRDATFFFF